jgi:PPK2 family polyphosphate:nucleotide phosphotransferase
MSNASEPKERMRAALLVAPGARADLAGRDTAWNGGPDYEHLDAEDLNATAKEILHSGVERLADAQELLWASDRYALLIVLQAIDAAGKDSTIKHVMSGVNPQGVQVVSFKQPSPEELDHDFLWRVHKVVPERGGIGIFNRSHYEEVVALRVHPDWLAKQRLPGGDRDDAFWKERFESINDWEGHLARNGTKIVKFFLHVSKAEQKRRFLRRLDTPGKEWKFSAADVVERGFWDQYMQAYDDAISGTSTEAAPWFVIPADRKHVMQAMVAAVLADTIEGLDLQWPTVTEKERQEHAEARRTLESEPDDKAASVYA